MIRLIIEKELRDIIGSTKFAVTFAVCALLILVTFYVGAKNHQINQQRFEAARAENLRQMEGLTDWVMVQSHRIFLPPQPLEALVSGVANDIGRTVDVGGRGADSASDSRFGDDPIFAVFRFLDLDFIFQIVLSLFAILFGYDAINGEKERGTLRLSFANAVPRAHYIIGKVAGSFLALALPLLIPILIGGLIFPLLGVQLNGNEWLRLALIVLAGFLYLAAFLMLSIFISASTGKSSNSFLMLLVIWIFAVLIIPRTAVLIAGRAANVPAVDEIASQRNRLSSQLWSEDRQKMSTFQPSSTSDPEKMIQEFQKFMDDLTKDREEKMQELTDRLNEDRRNRQIEQQQIAFGLAKLSPTAVFSLAASGLAGANLQIKEHFGNEAAKYQSAYREFMKEKTGMNLGGGMRFVMRRIGDGEEEQPKPIDTNELPVFDYAPISLRESANSAFFDLGLLAFFNVFFFAGAFVKFLRYDVR
jgi:ABC-type transport system involved in multi-copper enzyme maturation permease subunit